MNKIPIFFLLFLVTSMVFVTTPITVHADSQLDILIKISLNTKEHIKTDIEKAFKKVSIATETVADKSQQSLTPDRSQTIEKYENNIIKLKEISDKLNAGVDFEQIDQLLDLAKNNYAQGSFVQNEKVLSQIASEGREIHKLLYEISEQSKIYRAQHFAKKQAERITDLILEAKQIGLHQTAIDLEESKVQLLQANSTQVIKQQFKIIIIHKQKVDNAKDLQQAKFLKFKAILDSLENKAKKLASDVEVNSGAEYFLKKAFSLIEDVRMDIKDLEYAPTMMRDDSKYVDLTIGSKIKTIKDILVKVERLAYTSS